MRTQILHRSIVRAISTLVCLLGIVSLTFPLTPARRMHADPRIAPAADLPIRSATQLKSEAELFQRSMNEIARILTMKLTTIKELTEANAIVDKNIGNLKFSRSKLIAMGLADTTFTGAVKAKVPDKATAESFAIELAKEPTSIFKVSGGQALGDRMRSALNTDVGKIKQVAAILKKASEDLKGKSAHHAMMSAATVESPVVDLRVDDVAAIVIVVALVANPPLGVALLTVAVEVAVAAAVTILIANLIKNAATDEGRDAVEECTNKADRQYRRCVDAAKELGFFAEPAKAACYADWLLAVGECWIS